MEWGRGCRGREASRARSGLRRAAVAAPQPGPCCGAEWGLHLRFPHPALPGPTSPTGAGRLPEPGRGCAGLRWRRLNPALAAVLSGACTCASPILPSQDQPHPQARFQKSLGSKQAGVEGEGGKRSKQLWPAPCACVCLRGNCTVARRVGLLPLNEGSSSRGVVLLARGHNRDSHLQLSVEWTRRWMPEAKRARGAEGGGRVKQSAGPGRVFRGKLFLTPFPVAAGRPVPTAGGGGAGGGWMGQFEKMRQERVREVSPLASSSPLPHSPLPQSIPAPWWVGHLGGPCTWLGVWLKGDETPPRATTRPPAAQGQGAPGRPRRRGCSARTPAGAASSL